ncbi:MAG: hypothetical protein AAGD06_22300 [Acidobacteriota bacterium]
MRSEGCRWIWLALGLFCAPMAWGADAKGKTGSDPEPKATLSVGSLQDLTFWIDPHGEDDEIVFKVRETSGKLAIEGLKAEVLAAYLEIDDEIKIVSADSTEPWIQPLGKSWKVPVQGSAELRFKVQTPPKNGLLKVDLLLSSEDLKTPRTVSIQIATRHHWFGPMVVIALGVLLGYLVVYFGHSRPKEENRAALATLRRQMKSRSLNIESRTAAVDQRLLTEVDAAAELNEKAILPWTLRRHVETLQNEMPPEASDETKDVRPPKVSANLESLEVSPNFIAVWQREFVVAVVAFVVAVLTAFRSLYLDGLPFGTAADYIDAFLWGSGVEVTVRGFGPVLEGLRKLVAKP